MFHFVIWPLCMQAVEFLMSIYSGFDEWKMLRPVGAIVDQWLVSCRPQHVKHVLHMAANSPFSTNCLRLCTTYDGMLLRWFALKTSASCCPSFNFWYCEGSFRFPTFGKWTCEHSPNFTVSHSWTRRCYNARADRCWALSLSEPVGSVVLKHDRLDANVILFCFEFGMKPTFFWDPFLRLSELIQRWAFEWSDSADIFRRRVRSFFLEWMFHISCRCQSFKDCETEETLNSLLHLTSGVRENQWTLLAPRVLRCQTSIGHRRNRWGFAGRVIQCCYTML